MFKRCGDCDDLKIILIKINIGTNILYKKC